MAKATTKAPESKIRVPKTVVDFQKGQLAFQKNLFNETFNVMANLQDRRNEWMSKALDRVKFVPAEIKEVNGAWVDASKEQRHAFKGAVDETFEKLEGYYDRLSQ